MMWGEEKILRRYQDAKEQYASLGVDADAAIRAADSIPVSMHSWQGDDLIGFDGADSLSGGIAATGSYPGRAKTADQLRRDIKKALEFIPGKVKISLHACHAERGDKKIDRDAYTADEFRGWIDWARANGVGLDFNPTFISHPRMDGNFSLASPDSGVRDFWIEHGRRCREIGEVFGRELGQTCLVNYWMPDGYKDMPADTRLPRERMAQSLDAIFSAPLDKRYVEESVESKLFGLGVESYTVASHEFSYGYCVTRGKVYCLDAGHFHPTERISDKISAILQYTEKILLHLSRGVRWDSDHVVIWDDELQQIMYEVFRGGYRDRVYIGQDYFDASINRIACWTIAMRNTRKALLKAALEPFERIAAAEREGDYTARLALLEENRTLPFAAVWDYYCHTRERPVGDAWLEPVKRYERDVLLQR